MTIIGPTTEYFDLMCSFISLFLIEVFAARLTLSFFSMLFRPVSSYISPAGFPLSVYFQPFWLQQLLYVLILICVMVDGIIAGLV
jgi:hypothetical protein